MLLMFHFLNLTTNGLLHHLMGKQLYITGKIAILSNRNCLKKLCHQLSSSWILLTFKNTLITTLQKLKKLIHWTISTHQPKEIWFTMRRHLITKQKQFSLIMILQAISVLSASQTTYLFATSNCIKQSNESSQTFCAQICKLLLEVHHMSLLQAITIV